MDRSTRPNPCIDWSCNGSIHTRRPTGSVTQHTLRRTVSARVDVERPRSQPAPLAQRRLGGGSTTSTSRSATRVGLTRLFSLLHGYRSIHRGCGMCVGVVCVGQSINHQIVVREEFSCLYCRRLAPKPIGRRCVVTELMHEDGRRGRTGLLGVETDSLLAPLIDPQRHTALHRAAFIQAAAQGGRRRQGIIIAQIPSATR